MNQHQQQHPPPSHSSSADLYKSSVSHLTSHSLNATHQVDRSQIAAERRRIKRGSRGEEEEREEKQRGHANTATGQQVESSQQFDDDINTADMTSSSSTHHPQHHHQHQHQQLKLRIATPLPVLARSRPSSRSGMMMRAEDEESQINLLLPTPTSTSNLAAITQQTNERVANMLRYHDSDADDMHSQHHQHEMTGLQPTSPTGSRSHRLLLGHMTHLLTPQELESEKEISRLLSNWQSVKSAKSFANLTSKIKQILSERSHAEAGSSGLTGKQLNEDERISDELDKRGNALYRINVPSYATSIRIEMDVSEGRIELHVACGAPYSSQTSVMNAQSSSSSNGTTSQAKDSSSAAASSSNGNTNSSSSSTSNKSLWNLRGGIGHHVLAIHTSDALYKSSQNNDLLYVTVHAAQASVYGIRLSIGGRNKNNSSNNNNNGGLLSSLSNSNFDELDLFSNIVNYSSSPPGSRHASRHTTLVQKHAPSTRNLRATLEQRVRILSENPKAMKEFLQRVTKMKKGGGSSEKSGAHTNINTAASSSGKLLMPSAGEEKQNVNNNGLTSSRVSQSHLPTLVLASSSHHHQPQVSPPHPHPHPQPLTPTSLNHIAHIQAIDGVSEVFYECVKELNNECNEKEKILDEKDCIKYDREEKPSIVKLKSTDTIVSGTGMISPPRITSPRASLVNFAQQHHLTLERINSGTSQSTSSAMNSASSSSSSTT